MLTIRPQPRAFMPGRLSRMVWNGADRLTASVSSQCSGAKFSTAPNCRTTALFTTISGAATATMSAISAGCRNSAPWSVALTPSASMSAARATIVSAAAKPFSTTSQPRAASARAVAKPIPPHEPAIGADFPFSMRTSLGLSASWAGAPARQGRRGKKSFRVNDWFTFRGHAQGTLGRFRPCITHRDRLNSPWLPCFVPTACTSSSSWTITVRPMSTCSVTGRPRSICWARVANRLWFGRKALRKTEVRRAMRTVTEQQALLLQQWERIHGRLD